MTQRPTRHGTWRKYKTRKRDVVRQFYFPLAYSTGKMPKDEVINHLIRLHKDSPRNRHKRRTSRKRVNIMQRTFTLEVRMDCADDGKYEAMKQRVRIVGRQLWAGAALISQGSDVKPQIAVFSDDFYGNHEDIVLLEDSLAVGLEQIGGEEEQTIDPELAAAMKE